MIYIYIKTYAIKEETMITVKPEAEDLLEKLYMPVSGSIPLNRFKLIYELSERQQLPGWTGEHINDHYSFPAIQALFEITNSGISEEDFFYKGDIYRVHVACCSGNKKDGKILPETRYSDTPVSFSKSYDFTRSVYRMVKPTEKVKIIHANTGDMYGIDVNRFLCRFSGLNPNVEQEYEVLFPLTEKYVVKEYNCTPNQMNYYLRNKTDYSGEY